MRSSRSSQGRSPRDSSPSSARVIKIERPDGGDPARVYDRTVKGMSSHFVWVNRSKESLSLDLKRPQAKAILAACWKRRMFFSTTSRRVQWIAWASARASCAPGIRGSSGARSPATARRPVRAQESAASFTCKPVLLSVTGTPDMPVKAGIPAADIAAGMYAFSSRLQLMRRERTGEGATIDVTMLESLGEWMGFPALFTVRRHAAAALGPYHATIVPYGPFKAADGQTVFLSVQTSASSPPSATAYCASLR